jgi:hypothetical protein
METSSRHIVTLTLASCALQLIHLTPRPAVFSFDNLAIPNGVHSLVVDAPRFFQSVLPTVRMRGASLSAYTAVGAITCTPIHWSTRRTQVTSCTHPPRTRYPLWTELRFLLLAVENGCCSSKFHNTTGLRPASVIGRGRFMSTKLASDHASGRKPESQFFASGTFQFGLVTF